MQLAAAQRHGEQLGGELRAAQQRAADLARALETSKEEAAKVGLFVPQSSCCGCGTTHYMACNLSAWHGN